MPEGYIHRIRVRYADTDKMGVVYHGRYFEWFEAARTEMIRDGGMAYSELEAQGISLPVMEARCRYRRSVSYDELVRIRTWMGSVDRAKLVLHYEVMGETDDAVRVEATTVHCFMDGRGRAIRAPKEVLAFFKRMVERM